KSKVHVLILVAVLLALVIGVLLVWFFGRDSDQEKVGQVEAESVCTSEGEDSIIVRATKVMNPEDYGQLAPIAEEVVSLESYDRDPNCLYIEVVYYANI